jgi:hypothetical protein
VSVAFAPRRSRQSLEYYVFSSCQCYHAATAIVCRWVEVSNAVYYALVNDFMKPRIDEASNLARRLYMNKKLKR